MQLQLFKKTFDVKGHQTSFTGMPKNKMTKKFETEAKSRVSTPLILFIKYILPYFWHTVKTRLFCAEEMKSKKFYFNLCY